MITTSKSASEYAKPAIAVLATALCLSCKAPPVSGFEWKDSSGSSLAFAQSSGWTAGSEGSFDGAHKANRYRLERTLSLGPDQAIEVRIADGAAQPRAVPSPEPVRIKLSLSSEADGSSPSLVASFPLLEREARFVLNADAGARIASLSVESSGADEPFKVESVEIARVFRGIRSSKDSLEVSSSFSLSLGADGRELSIARPFGGEDPRIAGGTGDRADKAGDRAGILLEYGKASKPMNIRLEARLKDGSLRSFRLKTHPSGARTVLDESAVPRDTELLSLKAPAELEIGSFCAALLPRDEYMLADLGRVIRSEPGASDFDLFKWDMLPSVLVFDFKDYATQDKYLKRLAFFVEKAGYRGALAKDEELASLHGWNAHDYRAEDLASFFAAARSKAFPLGAEEKELESLLAEYGLLRESGGRIEAGEGALISISRESSDALRWTFAVHESTHAIFFTDQQYRDFVRSLWASVGSDEKWFWKTYLGWAMYDVRSDYLMGNEFQAYLLQQPKAMAEEYFSKRKADELLEKHPELKPRVDEYMAKFGKSFALRAGQLEAWLYAKYGVEAGRTIGLIKAK